ncbi:MAG: precorrin-2 C(20)-methyltransferase [Solirubrobacterales bacterium]
MTTGTLYGVGVGPGDPELLTLKAVRILREAPVLAWPAPLEGDGMARTVAAPHISAGKIEIPIRLAFRPERDDTEAAYGTACETIAGHLAAGRDVAVLCEGDPMFFGSFIHLLAKLGPAFPVAVVPGVAAMMAAAAAWTHPLATLDEALAVIPATRPEAEIERLLAAADAAVIMKVGRHLPKVRRVLARLGLDGHARFAERVGLPEQRLAPLAEIETAPYFSLILVSKDRP